MVVVIATSTVVYDKSQSDAYDDLRTQRRDINAVFRVYIYGMLVQWLRHKIFILVTRVQFPYMLRNIRLEVRIGDYRSPDTSSILVYSAKQLKKS